MYSFVFIFFNQNWSFWPRTVVHPSFEHVPTKYLGTIKCPGIKLKRLILKYVQSFNKQQVFIQLIEYILKLCSQ